MRNFKTTAAVVVWLGSASFGLSYTQIAQGAMVEQKAPPSVADAQAKYDSLVKEATAAANKAIEINKIATSVLADSTKAAAAAASAKANAATAKKNFDTANTAYTKLVAAQTAADTAVKAAQTALDKNKDAKKTASLKATLDKANITQKAAQAAAVKGKQAVADANKKYKDAATAQSNADANAKAAADKYAQVKKDATDSAAYAKSAADGAAAAKKVLDAAIAAAKSTGPSKVLSDTATNANGLTFKEELSEQLPRVMGAKGIEGPNLLTLTDNGYDSVACHYGMNWEAFKNDWVNGKLTKGKVNSWKIPLEPNRGGNARYWISCKATQGKTTVYSNTQEYIMQDYLSGTDWAKTRCDFPVSGKTDKFFFTAAAKVLKAEDAAYVGILPMDPELGANEKKEKARAKGGPAVNAIQQPYSAQFGSASIWNAATVSKKMSVNSDGTFLLVRRGWANPLSGCNLPGAMGNAKYQLKKGERMRWVPDHFTTAVFVDGLKAALFPMNKKAPVKGAKNIYNTNIKVGTALVLNSKGQGVLLDDNGAVQKKFTNGGKYLRRIFRHHSLEGEEGEQRFIHRNH